MITKLPINLSKIIFVEWIDVNDICVIDQSYCNKIYRLKMINILNNIIINNYKNDSNFNATKKLYYLIWIEKRKFYIQNIQIDNLNKINNNHINCNHNFLIFKYLNHLDLSNSEITNNELNQFFIQNKINNLKILNLTNCSKFFFDENNFKTIIENNIYLEKIIFDSRNENFNGLFFKYIIENCQNLKKIKFNDLSISID